MNRPPKFASDRNRARFSKKPPRGRSSSSVTANHPARYRRLPLDRESIFGAYVCIALIPTAVLIVLGISLWAHDTLIPGFASFISNHLVWYMKAVVDRPTLLLVLLFTVLLIWSIPWEDIISSVEGDNPSKGYRRGRQMLNQRQAQRQATQKRNNRRRNQ